jgi:hypothetical protein
MAKVKIQGNASGTGVLTVTAPNTSTDRTITLPDSTGTLLDENSSVPAANLTGTVADARFPATLPAASAANLTTIPAAEITGSIDYGYKNTPAFLAYATTANELNIPNTTWTKVVYANEAFDSDGKYASGTFTPTVAGQYVLSGMIEYEQQDNDTATYLKIYKNGSPIVGGRWFTMNPDGGGGGPNTSNFISTIVISDTNDYFELYAYQASGGRAVKNDMGTYSSHFSGYKLAGA